MAEPVKAFTTIDEQIELLESRGLQLDRPQAQQRLRSVTYYRLSGYWYPYRRQELDEHGTELRRDLFVDGTRFSDVVALYEFHRKLRTLIHDGIERVEIALRSHVSYVIGEKGAMSYTDPAHFRPTFNHAGWLDTAMRRADRARRHNTSIKHHDAKYGGQLPIWALTEVLDFADVSKLYAGMLLDDQWAVTERLGFSIDSGKLSGNQRSKLRRGHPLVRWFEQLSVVRNTCAHHARVWNCSFIPANTTALQTIDELRSLPDGQSEDLYGALTVIGFLLREISPGATWLSKVRGLIEGSLVPLHGRSVAEMGFPRQWRSGPLWSTGRP